DENKGRPRRRAREKKGPPPKGREDEPIDHRSEKETAGITLLQNPGGQAAGARRQTFHRERCAESPLATHSDPVERAKNEKHGEIRRKRGQQFHQGIENDVHHQRHPPTEPIAEQPKDQRAQWSHHERERDGKGHLDDRNRKLGRHVPKEEGEEKKIERIEPPPEEAGEEGVALVAIQ